jgi:hypothetical protein
VVSEETGLKLLLGRTPWGVDFHRPRNDIEMAVDSICGLAGIWAHSARAAPMPLPWVFPKRDCGYNTANKLA